MWAPGIGAVGELRMRNDSWARAKMAASLRWMMMAASLRWVMMVIGIDDDGDESNCNDTRDWC